MIIYEAPENRLKQISALEILLNKDNVVDINFLNMTFLNSSCFYNVADVKGIGTPGIIVISL
jgi:hypothetical protein